MMMVKCLIYHSIHLIPSIEHYRISPNKDDFELNNDEG